MSGAQRLGGLVAEGPLLYVIVDPQAVQPGADPVAVTRAACAGGARVIQLRAKVAPAREAVALARAMASVCREAGALLVVNDRLDVALAAEADGAHLGPNDIPIADARRIAPGLLLGASAGDAARAVALVAEGADYLGVGALFDARASKPDASAPRGVQVIADVRRAVDVPIVGIGGISEANARGVIEAGARGVAVIRAVCGQPDPERAARRLLEIMRGV